LCLCNNLAPINDRLFSSLSCIL